MALSATLSTPVTSVDESSLSARPQGFTHISAAFRSATAACVARGRVDAMVLEPTLCAITTFLSVFDALGSSVVTALVATDFRFKTDAVRAAMTRLNTDEAGALLQAERERPPGFFDACGVDGLRWMRRVLEFVDVLVLRLLSNKDMELMQAATEAYRETIGVHHSTVTKVMFENALQLLPEKATFIRNLFGIEQPTEAQMTEIENGMQEFRTSVRPHIHKFGVIFEND